MSLRAVVIDDEELARAHLRKMLRDADVDVIAEGESGLEALNLTESHQPDVLFMDIQMPDMTGMEAAAAVENLDRPPRIVFVTGYSDYAVQAFEKQAFDYLMKPVAPDRLALTVARARKMAEQEGPAHGLSDSPRVTLQLTRVQRLPVRTDYAIKLIRIEDIECAIAREKRVFVRAKNAEQRTYYTLTQLESLLPREEFLRIHASAIARIDLIESVNFLGNHTYSISLAGGAVLPVGRAYYAALQGRLGI